MQVAKLTDAERENFIGLLEAMGEGDGRRAARHVLAFAAQQTCVGERAEGFEAAMAEVFAAHCRGYNTGVDIGVVLRETLARVRLFHVRVDVNYATLLINLLCLEGIAGALLPSYNILDRAAPLLAPHSNRFVRPVFRRLFPLLLALKRRGEGALFRALKRTGRLKQQEQKEEEAELKRRSQPFLPADTHAHPARPRPSHGH
jgi:predicted unusual protein kinase regulating ubiquinone biosynthesis (AarF/ABC1/UbiB family)